MALSAIRPKQSKSNRSWCLVKHCLLQLGLREEPYTAISRNVVGKKQKTAQANPERYFGIRSMNFNKSIAHFTVVCLVTWPLSGIEAGVDLVLVKTLLLFTCKSCYSHAN